MLLAEVLILSAVALVPGASRTALGWGLLGVSVVAWAVVSRVHLDVMAAVRAAGAAVAPRGSGPIRIFLGQAAAVAFVVGAVTLIADGGGGLYWFAPGVAFAFVTALTNAWVLLIEIQR